MVVRIKADFCSKNQLGTVLDEQFIKDLSEEIHSRRKHGGYHAFVIDGTLFRRKVEITKLHKKFKERTWMLDE